MKFVFCLLSLVFARSLTAQAEFNKNDAKEVIETFFEGFHTGDTTLMKSVMIKDLPTETVFTDRQGNHRILSGAISEFLAAIANRPKEQIWEEKLLSYEIKIDGNLAHVWTPYEFWLDGVFSHCGANSFTLGNTNDGWKIIHLIDSRRKEDCIH